MTREEFLAINWNDNHVGYDMKVGNYRTIAYLTTSRKYPNCLCLVTDNKDFPTTNSGCGYGINPSPADIITILEKRQFINRIVAVIDGEVYDLKPGTIYVNGIDNEVMFDEIPFDTNLQPETNDKEKFDIYELLN